MPDRKTLRKVERPVRLAQRAFDEIREALLKDPGEQDLISRDDGRLIEEDLARVLEMSRTPVREALHRLLLVGMIEPASGGGYMRRRTTRRGVIEHSELRLVLEPHAAALVAERVASGDTGISETLRDIGQLDPSNPFSDIEFHMAIANAAQSHSLPELIGELNDLAGLDAAFLGCSGGISEDLRTGHQAVLEHIERGESEAAREAMYEHLVLVQDAMLEALEARLSADDTTEAAA